MPKVKKRTDEELRKIAWDAMNQKLFMSDQFRSPDEAERMLRLVFIPLGFLEKKGIAEIKRRKVAHFYEYYERALPRSVNGLPQFISCYSLTDSEYAAVRKYEAKFRAEADALLHPKKKNEQKEKVQDEKGMHLREGNGSDHQRGPAGRAGREKRPVRRRAQGSTRRGDVQHGR